MKKSAAKQDIIWLMLFTAVLVLSVWKVRYGYVIDDEAFYSTIPNRLSFGDIFFRDEWHLSQLSGFLTLPFIEFFHSLHGTNEGLLLFMRCCYLALHSATSAILYVRLRRYGIFSVFASVLFYLFVPGNIMALSYNTMGVDLTALACVFLLGNSPVSFILSGLLFAGAVLCCPYLILVFFIYFLSVIIIASAGRRRLSRSFQLPMFSFRAFLFFLAGTALPAAAFLLFFLSRAEISDVFRNLPYMLLDPEHQNTSLFLKIPRYFSSILLHSVRGWGICILLYVLIVAAFWADRGKKVPRSVYFASSCLLMCLCLILSVPTLLSTDFTSMMFPLMLPSFMAYILLENRPAELFYGVFIPGILYSLCIHLSSNQTFFVISMALSVSCIAGIIFMGMFAQEVLREYPKRHGRAAALLCVAVCLALQAGFESYVRIEHTFRDASPSKLGTVIENGPFKGIKTGAGNAYMYTSVLEDLKYYDSKPAGNLLVLAKEPWYYLQTYNQRCASYSAWIAEEDDTTLDMLDMYYSVNPAKKPDYIYISKYSSWDFSAVLDQAQSQGYYVDDETGISIKLARQN